MTLPARNNLDDLWSGDRSRQNAAYTAVMEDTSEPVSWAFEIWDEALGNLAHKDNHNRAIAAQPLCSLAKSDPELRILRDFEHLLR